MSDTPNALLSLAKEDHLIIRKQKLLDKIPAQKEKLRKPLNLIERDLKKTEKDVEALDQQAKIRQNLIVVEQEKVTTADKRMMEVTNQKEYSAIQKELDGAKRTIKKMEDQIQETEEKKEPLKEKMDELQQEYNDENTKFEEVAKDLIQEETDLQAIIDSARNKLSSFKKEIEASDLQKYELLMSHGKAPAAVEVNNAFCRGCALSIRPQVFNDLIREGQGECPNCKRILFYKAPEIVEEVKPKKPRAKAKAKVKS